MKTSIKTRFALLFATLFLAVVPCRLRAEGDGALSKLQERLLTGVSTIGMQAGCIPGNVLVLDRQSVLPLAYCKNGDNTRGFVAAAGLPGKGRFLYFGHPAFLQLPFFADTKALYANALPWLTDGAEAPKIALLRCKEAEPLLREILGEKAPHAAADGWKSDKDGHWKVCKDCGAAIGSIKPPHSPDRDAADYENPVLCTDCGYEIAPVRPDVNVTVTIPFSMTVKKTGEAAPGQESFKLTFVGMMPDGLKDFVTIVNDTIETNGEKTYTGSFVFTIKASKLNSISDGIQLTQVKGSAEGWTYDETLYYVTLDIEDETVSLRDVSIMGEGDEFIPLNPKEDGSPLVAFTNSYNASLPTPPVKTGDAGITLWVSLAALSGLVMLAIPELKKRKTHR